MENKPKKSKAIIITIILILLLLLVGFLVLRNKNFFGPKTYTPLPASENQPGFFAKLFSPLIPSSNPTGLNTGENSNVGNAEAGENIKQGDTVYKTGTGTTNIPIVKTTGLQNQNKYGVALEDIKTGEIGNILIDKSFWDSVKDWVGNIFTSNPSNSNRNECTNGGTNPPTCTTIDGNCINNATNPPLCTTIGDGTDNLPTISITANPTSVLKGESSTISWTSTNSVSCSAGEGNGTGKTGSFSTGPLNESKSFTVTCTGANGTGSANIIIFISNSNSSGMIGQCSDGADNDGDGKMDTLDPNCHVGGVLTGDYVPTHYSEVFSPIVVPGGGYTPQCSDTKDNDTDGKTDTLDPNCHVGGVLTGDYVPTHYSEVFSPIVVPGGGGYTSQCSDGADNDGDGKMDTLDPNCYVGGVLTGDYVPTHYSEVFSPIVIPGGGYTPQCSDTKDNDNDTFIDNADPECHVGGVLTGDYVPTHYSEVFSPIVIPGGGGYTPQCSDTKDNDTDGKIDTLDPNCYVGGILTGDYVPTHNSEIISPIVVPGGGGYTPQCSDTKDNDGDKLIDFADPDCHTDKNAGNPYSYDKNIYLEYGLILPRFPTVTVTADPITIAKGGTSTISWISTNATSCEETTGQGGKLTTGTFGTGPLEISKAYTVTCTGTGVSGKVSGTAFVFINPEIILPQTECSDGISNNDNDTFIDGADPECHTDGNAGNAGSYDKYWYSENAPWGGTPQCNDKIDNDQDKLIDFADPDCHTDKNAGNPYSYDKNIRSEYGSLPPICSSPKITDSGTGKCIDKSDCKAPKVINGDRCEDSTACLSPKITDSDTGQCINKSDCKAPKVVNGDRCEYAIIPQNICLDIEQNPLTFTPEEKARLAVLLRKFYLISSTLRTSDDISNIYSEIDQQKNFMSEIDGLTKQCYLEVNDKDYSDTYYTARQNLSLRRGNPWYQESKGGIFPYSSNNDGYVDYNWLDPGCQAVSGYYYGTATTKMARPIGSGGGFIEAGESCDGLNDPTRKDDDTPTGTKVFNNCNYINTQRTGNFSAPPEEKYLEAGCKWKEGVDFTNTERILNIW